jgi:AraC-like DNA-binding protein
MGLVAILSRDPAVCVGVQGPGPGLPALRTRTPAGLLRVVRERPVVAVVVDSAAVADGWEVEALVREIRRRFPSLGIVLVARPALSPLTLLQLGRARFVGLRVLRSGELQRGLGPSLARVGELSTRSLVLRAVGNHLGTLERGVVRTAFEVAALGWGADDLASHVGWSRAHLGVRLREKRLPPPGRLLLWARLIHAARWIPEPGRTAESVSRQLGYANGSTFRRVLRSYLGQTPTQLVDAGGFPVALEAFLDVCGLGDTLGHHRSVA